MVAKTKLRIVEPPRVAGERIPSDGCEVTINGEAIYPHEGQWVEMLPVRKVSDLQAIDRMMAFGDKLAIARDDSMRELVALLSEEYGHFCELLSRRVLAWDWTDMVTGEPLPQPFGCPEVLAELSEAELLYLTALLRGHRPEARKND